MDIDIHVICLLLFYYSLIFILYIHFLYPILLLFVSFFNNKCSPNRSEGIRDDSLMSVTLLIAAYNEEAIIEEKIINSLNLDYPKDLLEIIVFSDGSTDGTDSIVHKYCKNRVKLVRIEGRVGKTACQNIAAGQATGQIVIYSDATSIYRKDAVLQLVRRFNVDDVGCVIGRVGSEIEFSQENVANEETLYLKFSQWVKNLEDCVSMPVGASGAIFAIRKKLLVDLPAIANDDLLRPLSVIQQGFSVVYERKACAFERFSDKYEDILAKKIRIAKRAVFSISYAKLLLNPLNYGIFSLQFLTKTLLRRLLLPHYIFLLLSSMALAYITNGVIYSFFLAIIILVLLLSAIGKFSLRSSVGGRTVFFKGCRFCYYYILAISGAFAGILLGLSGNDIYDWKPSRR